MINKYDYEVLRDIFELQGHCFAENDRPSYIPGDHVIYLMDLGYLKRITLVPPNYEPEYPSGLSGIKISSIGISAMYDFEDKLADRRHQRIMEAVTILLGILALPNALEGVVSTIRRLF